jgi:PAS domain S-box-containing protein
LSFGNGILDTSGAMRWTAPAPMDRTGSFPEEEMSRVEDEGPAPRRRDSDRLYRALVETLDIGIYVADARNRFTYCNPAMCAIGGYTPEDLLGTVCFRHIVREDRGEVMRKVAGWAADPAVHEAACEFRVLARAGKTLWVAQHTLFIRDEAGRVLEARNSLRDISERQASEAALRASERRFRELVENINQGFYIADARSLFTYCNPAIVQLGGWTDEELRGTSSFRFVAPEDRQRIVARYIQWANSTATSGTVEFRTETKSGKKLWLEQVTQIVRHPDGRVQEFRCFLTNITERKLAETTLRDSERQFKGLFEESPIPIILLDAAGGHIREVNKAATDTFGYTREEVLGKSTLELGTWPDPQERERLINVLRTEGAVRSLETTMRGAGGRLVHVLFNATQITIRGVPCLLNSVIDITNLKRAEQLFHDLFAFSPDAYFITTARGEITDVNERMIALFGYDRAELVGYEWSMLFPEAARAGLQELARRYFENPTAVPMGSSAPGLVARTKDGRVFPIDVSLSPLQSGGEVRIVAAVRDITAQLKAAEDLKRSEAQLRQAQKMESLGTLAGGIAHDFNNILTGILGHAQLAIEDLPADHPARPWMDGIVSSGARAKNLVQQILTFSRKTESTRHTLRLQQVTQETAGLLRSTIPAMVRIETAIDAGCPPVLADGTQIHQVILNLCTNAWHALPDSGGLVTVGLGRRSLSAAEAEKLLPLAAGEYAVLSVRDNGRGMDPATLERIFEPFFTTKDSGKGTGLGLAVVHSIVAAHGGAIAVHSRPGEGSLFEVYLPALPDTGPAAAAPSQAVARGHGEHVLVVDDEPTSGGVIAMLIERLGYQATYCDSPTTALRLLEEHVYAMLVTDLAMPGLPGDELARLALARQPDLPVMLLSGYLAPGKLESVRALGVREVLAKPPGYDELAVALHRCLRK